MSDRKLIYTSAFVRAFATGLMGVLLGIHLARLNLDKGQIGLVLGSGLAGAALAAILTTFAADRLGRRRIFLSLCILSAAGGVALTQTAHPLLLAAAAFIGMANGMGRDRGAALILDQALLPATTTDEKRTATFAAYNVLQDVGHALGGLAAGLPSLLPLEPARSMQVTIWIYAALMGVPILMYLMLSAGIVGPIAKARVVISPPSKSILWKICSLFALDSLGGGFLITSLMAYYFYEKFHVGEGTIAVLFFAARSANALSHIGAAWLAKRIGLVNTMVFTHIPSSLLLATVPFAPNFTVAAIMFLLRESLVEMDVPTRQSYVMAVVRPEERTFASGTTHIVRMGAWAVAPLFAGLLMNVHVAAPILAGAGLKIVYDVLLYRAFRNLRPPEEIKPPA